MSNYIGIVMAGWVDEDSKLLTRSELNKRIVAIQAENKELKSQLRGKDLIIKLLKEKLKLAEKYSRI